MEQKTGMSRIIESDIEKQYDEIAKKILSHKKILANILKRTVAELEDMTVDEIIDCFEGEVSISKDPLFPEFIKSENLEDSHHKEGTIYFDLRFTITRIEGKPKILFDVEAQKDYRPGYPIVSRGVVYGARMIAAQVNYEYTLTDYSGVKKVYSIWVCFNPPKSFGNGIKRISLKEEDLLGHVPINNDDYDKISIVMIFLNADVADNEDKTIRLLNTLFSGKKEAEEIETILEEEYDIPRTVEDGKGIRHMCNLGEMLVERERAECIKKTVELLREVACSEDMIQEKIQEKYSLTSEEAREYLS